MSEFSDSLHLQGEDADAAVALLTAASADGFVLGRGPPFVPFVCGPREADLEDARRLCKVEPDAPSFVIDYAIARDAQNAAIARVLQASTNPLLRYFFDADHECFVEHGLLDPRACDEISAWLETAPTGEPYFLASILGLQHYAWTSHESLVRAPLDPNVIAVRG